jgi:arginine decarboxylase-like protein
MEHPGFIRGYPTIAYQLTDCLFVMQINDIGIVKEGMSEASYLYAELVHMGANMRYVDVGGGLAIDYDGSATGNPMSLSYNMQASAQALSECTACLDYFPT